jgi:hypothetical protein
MKINIKKILSIILLVLLVAGAVWGVWFFLVKKNVANIPILNTFEDSEDFFGIDNSGNDLYDPEFIAENNTENTVDLEKEPPILRQISFEPVAGYITFQKEFEVLDVDGTTTEAKKIKKNKNLYRFMERVSGNIYETIDDNLALNKISGEEIKKVNKATFLENGETIIYEQLDSNNESINSFWGNFVKKGTSTTEFEFKTEPLSIIYTNFVSSPNGKEYAYQVKNINSSSIFLGTNKKTTPKEIYGSPIKEWNIDWQNGDLISLNTKPSSDVSGHLFLLNTKNGSLKKVVSDVSGLTTKLSPSGKFVLIGENSQNNTSLYLKDLTKNETKKLAISTLPEKCVFSNKNENTIYCASATSIPRGLLPDDWYKGKVSFNDFLWEFDIASNRSSSLYLFEDSEKNFDITDTRITKDDKFLTFINKNDLTLWSLDIDRAKNR